MIYFHGIKFVATLAETVEFNFTRSDPEHRAGRRRKAECGGRRGDKEEGRVEEGRTSEWARRRNKMKIEGEGKRRGNSERIKEETFKEEGRN